MSADASSPHSTPSPQRGAGEAEDLMTSSHISHLELPRSDRPRGNGVPSSSSSNSLLTPTDLLNRAARDSSLLDPSVGDHSRNSSNFLGDDSALDLLVDAHGRETREATPAPDAEQDGEESTTADASISSLPSHRDASFGLDPDADVSHAVKAGHSTNNKTTLGGLTSLLKGSSSGSGEKSHSHSHHHEHKDDHHWHGHSATGATTKPHSSHEPDTEPTVSASGMPRVLPRHHRRTSESSSVAHSSSSSEASAPREMQPATSGSLTLAAFAPGLPLARRAALLAATIGINIGLPFINGVMLGFGEIFARAVLAPWLGLAAGAMGVGSPSWAETLRRETGVRSGASGSPGTRAFERGAQGVEINGMVVEKSNEGRRR